MAMAPMSLKGDTFFTEMGIPSRSTTILCNTMYLFLSLTMTQPFSKLIKYKKPFVLQILIVSK